MQPINRLSRNLETLSGGPEVNRAVTALIENFSSLHQYLLAGMTNQTQLLLIAQSMADPVNDPMIKKIIDIIGEEFGGLRGPNAMQKKFKPLMFSSAKLLELVKRFYSQMVMIEGYKQSFTKGAMGAVLDANPIEKIDYVLQNDNYIKMKFQYAIIKQRLVDEMSEFDTQYGRIMKYMNDAQELNAALVEEVNKTAHRELLAKAELLSSLRKINGVIVNSALNLGQTTIIERQFDSLKSIISSYEFTQLQFDPAFIDPLRPITDLDGLYKRLNKTVLAIKNEGRGLDGFAKFISGRERTERDIAEQIRMRAQLKTEREKDTFNRVKALVDRGNTITTKIVYNQGAIAPMAKNIIKCANETGRKLTRCVDNINAKNAVGSAQHVRELIHLLMKKKKQTRRQGIYVNAINKLSKVLFAVEGKDNKLMFNSMVESAKLGSKQIMAERRRLDKEIAQLQADIAEFNASNPDVKTRVSMPMGVRQIGITIAEDAKRISEDSPHDLVQGIFDQLTALPSGMRPPKKTAAQSPGGVTLYPDMFRNLIGRGYSSNKFSGGGDPVSVITDTKKLLNRISASFGVVETDVTKGKSFIKNMRQELDEKYGEIMKDTSKTKDEKITLMIELRARLADQLKNSSGAYGIDVNEITSKLSSSTVKSIIYTLYSLNELALYAVSTYIKRVYSHIKHFSLLSGVTETDIFGKFDDDGAIWVVYANLYKNRDIWRGVAAMMEKSIDLDFVKALFDKVFLVGTKHGDGIGGVTIIKTANAGGIDEVLNIENVVSSTNFAMELLKSEDIGTPRAGDDAPTLLSLSDGFKEHVIALANQYINFISNCPIRLGESYPIHVDSIIERVKSTFNENVFVKSTYKYGTGEVEVNGHKFVPGIFTRTSDVKSTLDLTDLVSKISTQSVVYTSNLTPYVTSTSTDYLLMFSPADNADSLLISPDRALTQISKDNSGRFNAIFKPAIDASKTVLVANALRAEIDSKLNIISPDLSNFKEKMPTSNKPRGSTSTPAGALAVSDVVDMFDKYYKISKDSYIVNMDELKIRPPNGPARIVHNSVISTIIDSEPTQAEGVFVEPADTPQNDTGGFFAGGAGSDSVLAKGSKLAAGSELYVVKKYHNLASPGTDNKYTINYVYTENIGEEQQQFTAVDATTLVDITRKSINFNASKSFIKLGSKDDGDINLLGGLKVPLGGRVEIPTRLKICGDSTIILDKLNVFNSIIIDNDVTDEVPNLFVIKNRGDVLIKNVVTRALFAESITATENDSSSIEFNGSSEFKDYFKSTEGNQDTSMYNISSTSEPEGAIIDSIHNDSVSPEIRFTKDSVLPKNTVLGKDTRFMGGEFPEIESEDMEIKPNAGSIDDLLTAINKWLDADISATEGNGEITIPKTTVNGRRDDPAPAFTIVSEVTLNKFTITDAELLLNNPKITIPHKDDAPCIVAPGSMFKHIKLTNAKITAKLSNDESPFRLWIKAKGNDGSIAINNCNIKKLYAVYRPTDHVTFMSDNPTTIYPSEKTVNDKSVGVYTITLPDNESINLVGGSKLTSFEPSGQTLPSGTLIDYKGVTDTGADAGDVQINRLPKQSVFGADVVFKNQDPFASGSGDSIAIAFKVNIPNDVALTHDLFNIAPRTTLNNDTMLGVNSVLNNFKVMNNDIYVTNIKPNSVICANSKIPEYWMRSVSEIETNSGLNMMSGGQISPGVLMRDPDIQLTSLSEFKLAMRNFANFLNDLGWEYLINIGSKRLKDNYTIASAIKSDTRGEEMTEHYDYQISLSHRANEQLLELNRSFEKIHNDIGYVMRYVATIAGPLSLAVVVAKQSKNILVNELAPDRIFGYKDDKTTLQLQKQFVFTERLRELLNIYKPELQKPYTSAVASIQTVLIRALNQNFAMLDFDSAKIKTVLRIPATATNIGANIIALFNKVLFGVIDNSWFLKHNLASNGTIKKAEQAD